jgi:fibronectin-binding autotransporter adhesin
MKHKCVSLRFAAALSLSAVLLPVAAHAQANSWTNANAGKWEIRSNWSLGVAPTNTHSVLITNTASKTVSIDATTADSFPGTMTINNLQVSAPAGATNTLSMVNAGLAVPLHLINSFTISAGGSMTITNSAVLVDGMAPVAWAIDGNLSFLDGSIVSTNIPASRNIVVGSVARGQMSVAGGSLSASAVYIGNAAGAQGTLTISGGTNAVNTLFIAPIANATGTVWMTDGLLTGNFGTTLRVGNSGVGQMVISNGSVRAFDVALRGPSCTLTMAGGTIAVASTLQIPNTADSTGSVWVTGGQLTVTNGTTSLGGNGVGQLIVSNGTFLARDVSVAGAGSGTLTIAGGTTALSSNLSVTIAGAIGRTGTVWITNGRLEVTNATTSVGVQGFGRFTVSNGTWLAKNVFVGEQTFGHGTLNIAGGTNALAGGLTIGNASSATGLVWMSGGHLFVTNATTLLGGNGVGEMTVSNGMWFARDVNVALNGTLRIAGGTNTLFLSSAGNALVVPTGTLWLNGGLLSTTNNPSIIGNTSLGGQMTISNGNWQAKNVTVASNPGAVGTLTLAGGSINNSGSLLVSFQANSTGVVWMTGGSWLATGDSWQIGGAGSGQMIISNGIVMPRSVSIGVGVGAGTLTFVGGTNNIASGLTVGSAGNGTMWMAGDSARLFVTNGATQIGISTTGKMTVSNGIWFADQVSLGVFSGSQGTLTVAGGTNNIFTGLTIGTADCSATGTVQVVGGGLFVTNSTADAVLDVRTGSLLLDAGTLTIDQLIITNACGRFIRSGGSLSITTTNLAPSLDADGDGIPNSSDPEPFTPFIDSDGDGLSDEQELLAGTDPNDSASFFGITSITQVTTNILITWMTGIGRTNALDRSAGDASAGFTNVFVPIFTVTNTVDTTSNYLDVGAASASTTSRYYRVRLVP